MAEERETDAPRTGLAGPSARVESAALGQLPPPRTASLGSYARYVLGGGHIDHQAMLDDGVDVS